MASFLATGEGASGGLEEVLHRMMQEQALARQQTESERHNRSDEGLRGLQIQELSADRRSRDAERVDAQKALQQNREENTTLRRVALRPDGSDVTPGERDKETAMGIPMGNYVFKPANLGMSTPQGEVGPSGESLTWRSPKPPKAGGDYNREVKTVVYNGKPIDAIFDPRAASASGAAGTYFHPETGEDITGQVQHYEKPQQPDRVVVNTAEGLVPRGEVTDRFKAGKTMDAPLPAMTRQRMYSSRQVVSHFADLHDEINEADKRGLLGPLEGRWAEFLRGTIGSTGDDANDELLNTLRDDLKLTGSGTMMAHFGARGGQNLIEDFQRDVLNQGKMSKSALNASVNTIEKWLNTYGTNPATGETGKPAAKAPGKQVRYDMNGNPLP